MPQDPQVVLQDPTDGSVLGHLYADGNGDVFVNHAGSGNEVRLHSGGVDVNGLDVSNVGSLSTETAAITNWSQSATFTIYKHNGSVKAMDPNGVVQHTGSDPGAVINSAILDIPNYAADTTTSAQSVNGGGRIHLTGYFDGQATEIVVPGSGDFDANYCPVQITGEGWGTGLKQADGANLDAMISWERKETSGQAHGHTVSNVQLHGNKANNTGTKGVRATNPSGYSGTLGETLVENTMILNTPGRGIDFERTSDADNIYGTLVEGCGDIGVVQRNSEGAISNVIVGNCASNGLAVAGRVSNLWSWGNDGKGLVCYAGSERTTTVGATRLSGNNEASGGDAAVFVQSDCNVSVTVDNKEGSGTHAYVVEFDGSDATVEAAVVGEPLNSHVTGWASADGNIYNGEGISDGAPTASDWDPGDRIRDYTNSDLYWKLANGSLYGPV